MTDSVFDSLKKSSNGVIHLDRTFNDKGKIGRRVPI